MKLINIKGTTPRQERAIRLCMAGSALSFNRDEALEALQDQIAAIEPDSKVLGRALAVPQLGRIDLVCVDGKGRLITVGVSDELTPDDLGRSIMRGQWAADNVDMLQHIYSRRFVSHEVRVWIAAQSISAAAQAIAVRMNGTAPELYTCEALELGSETWLVVRRHGAAGESPKVGRSVEPAMEGAEPAEDKARFSMRSVLTKEEIDDFFAPAIGEEEEEITNNGSVFRDL